MNKKQKDEFNFKLYEKALGTMYHLILDRPTDSGESVKYVSCDDKPLYATVNGNPVFFNWDKEFRIATEYTIMYPKIYVKASKPYKVRQSLERCYIH